MLPIEEYGVIGDCRSLALVGKNGSIDWLSWPRFDSAPVFWSLLDASGGRWLIAPEAARSVRREYLEHTNVLATEFTADGGRVRVVDCMPVAAEDEKAALLMPEREILRVVEGVEGACEVVMRLRLRPEFGELEPRFRRYHGSSVRFERGRSAWLVAADVPLEVSADGEVTCQRRVAAGERFAVSLSYAEDGPGVMVPFGARTSGALERTVAYWRRFVRRARYAGPRRELVLRSLLTLKLLTYAPSGAIVAAATTSLPERPGGDLNWDYRYAWMRDSALTVSALLDLGYEEYASSFVGWLLHATRLTRPELRVLYDVYGRAPEKERSVAGLDGWFGAKPVRVGNAAEHQLQLDGYGEVIDAVAQLARRDGVRLDSETQRLLVDFGLTVCKHYREPDAGLWETREAPELFTHSRVLCWVALERLLELADRKVLTRVPRERFEAARDELAREIEARGYDPELGSYTQAFGGRALDTSLLQLAWYGYKAPADPRMRSTFRRIVAELRASEDLLYRNAQSLESGEGAFGISCFWAVEYLARGGGSLAEAEEWFERLAGYANDVGLFSEEIEPRSGAALGNFPQAFTHVGLINAGMAIARRAEAERGLA